jgi:hypothetical protein
LRNRAFFISHMLAFIDSILLPLAIFISLGSLVSDPQTNHSLTESATIVSKETYYGTTS